MLQTTRLVLAIGLFLRSVSFLNWSCIVFATFSEFPRSVLCWSRAGCDCRLWLASLCCGLCSSTGQKWAVSIRWCRHLVSTAVLTFNDPVFRQLTNLNRRCDKGHKILFFLRVDVPAFYCESLFQLKEVSCGFEDRLSEIPFSIFSLF